MAENTAKIIIDASVDGVLRAAEQVKKKFTEVGEQGGHAGEKMLVGLGKSLLTAGMLIKVAKGIAEAFNEAASSAAKLSRETGGKTLGAETAGSRLGLSSAQTASVMNAAGPRSADERLQFLQSLATAKGPGGRHVDAAGALQAAGIFNTGGQESDELLETLTTKGSRGLSANAAAGRQRLAGFGDTARSEQFIRSEESAAALRVSDTAGEAGIAERRRLANNEARKAEHVGGYMFSDAVSNAGGAPFVEAGDRWLQQISENTRPRLNTSANGP